jgi:nitrite reductase (NADH) small subunit
MVDRNTHTDTGDGVDAHATADADTHTEAGVDTDPDATGDAPDGPDGYVRVAEADSVAPGRGMGIEVDGIELAVFNVDGEYYALSNRCPHQRAPLCKVGEPKINGDKCWTETRGGFTGQPAVTCPWHLWEINLETGEHETSGKRIATFDVREADGALYVRI